MLHMYLMMGDAVFEILPEPKGLQDAFAKASKFIRENEKSYGKCYYQRYWWEDREEGGTVVIDFGSHVDFINIVGVDEEIFAGYMLNKT